jgi:hypothetical protein
MHWLGFAFVGPPRGAKGLRTLVSLDDVVIRSVIVFVVIIVFVAVFVIDLARLVIARPYDYLIPSHAQLVALPLSHERQPCRRRPSLEPIAFNGRQTCFRDRRRVVTSVALIMDGPHHQRVLLKS